MDKNREIHSLDYSLCVLVAAIDKVCHGHGKPWKAREGLNVEILEHKVLGEGQDKYEEVRVLVRPVGWQKEEMIFVRCSKSGSQWWPFEGAVCSSRLPEELHGRFGFKVEAWSPSHSLKGFGDREQSFLRKACPEQFENQPS